MLIEPNIKTKTYTQEEVKAVNHLLLGQERIRNLLEEGKRLYVDHQSEILVPKDLEQVKVSPLWFVSDQDGYLILCAQEHKKEPDYWLCKYTDTLLGSNRKLEILVHVKEWINYQYPDPRLIDLEKRAKGWIPPTSKPKPRESEV